MQVDEGSAEVIAKQIEPEDVKKGPKQAIVQRESALENEKGSPTGEEGEQRQ